MNKDKTYIVGVYGSLKKNQSNHRIIEDSKFLGEVWSEPNLTMYSLGGFPALTKDGTTSILFEIYEVDYNTLMRVYSLEGYNGRRGDRGNTFYDTADIETPFGSAEFFYFKEEPTGNSIVESGNWQGGWRRGATA